MVVFVHLCACVCTCLSANESLHIDTLYSHKYVCRCMQAWFLTYCVVLISSTVAYVTVEGKKMKMSKNNLIPVMQWKYTLAHLHGEMKYEV